MIRFFKSPQPATLFIIPLIALLLWIQSAFKSSFVVTESGMPLFLLFTRFLTAVPVFIQVLLAIAAISLEAIYFNNLLNRHEVLYKNSYMPAFMYVLLMSLGSSFLQFHPLILVNLLLLRALDKTFSLFKNDSPVSLLFDSCFLISIASLIYFPASTLFILFLVSLAILRHFNMREWMISIIGFAIPYFFLSVYFFWTDQFISGWKKYFNYLVPGHSQFGFPVGQPLKVLLIMTGILFLLSLYRLRKNFYKNIVRARVFQQILLLFFVIAASSSFLLKTIPLFQLTMLAIPLSAFYSYYFISSKRRPWISELILWVMIGIISWNHL